MALNYDYVVATLAGSPGQAGSADGLGAGAQFNQPLGICLTPTGSFYVSDFNNSTIRLVTAQGSVSTPLGLAGNPGSADGKNASARFNGPAGLVMNGVGDVMYVSDYSNSTIREVLFSQKGSTLVGLVSTLAGTPGEAGYQDGVLSVALFNGPLGLALDSSDNLYVADHNNHTIREITTDGQVITIGGVAGFPGSADGSTDEALFNYPTAVAVDSGNNVYVADSGNYTIREISSAGVVSTIAGTVGVPGSSDGTGTNASFGLLNGIAIDGSGYLYVTDGSNTIRRVSPAGVVTTLAGMPGVFGSADGGGSSVLFSNPVGICVSSSGSGYVVDQGNDTIRQTTLVELPSITIQPQSQSVTSGVTVVFTVAAVGDRPLAYQWFKNGASVTRGGRSATLTLTNVQTGDAGIYTVTVSNAGGSVNSQPATLLVNATAPTITSPATASGKQGDPMSFQIQAKGTTPYVFFVGGLPTGCVFDPTNNTIAGTPVVSGMFDVTILATNIVGAGQQTLALTIASSVPQITSPNLVQDTDDATPAYQITATDTPTNYWATGLPSGLVIDPATGNVLGLPDFIGEYDAVIFAQNMWGTGSTNLHLSISGGTISSLLFFNGVVTPTYSKPYLMDFEFKLVDGNGNSVIRPVGDFTIQAFENAIQVNNDSSGVILQPATPRQLKASLLLDYSFAMEFGFNIDTNGISDGINNMQMIANDFIAQTPANTLFMINEFNSDDAAPTNVVGASLTNFVSNKSVLSGAIDGILTNYVRDDFGGSRLYDGLMYSLSEFAAAPGPVEQRVLLVMTDGNDTSSSITGSNAVSMIESVAVANKVSIFAIGYGQNVNTTVLDALTQGTGGQLYTPTDTASLLQNLALIAKDIQGVYDLRWTSLNRSSDAVIEPSFILTLSSNVSVSFNTNAVPQLIQETYYTYTAVPPPDCITLVTSNRTVTTNIIPGDATTNYWWVFNPHLTLYTNVTYVSTNITATNQMSILDPNPPVPYYFEISNVGSIFMGEMNVTSDPTVTPVTISISASYVPRYVRQLHLYYRPNWPCVVQMLSTNTGEIMQGWTMTQTNDGAGGFWITASSQNISNLLTSMPFACQGPLFNFVFRDMQVTNQAFSVLKVDTSIYTNWPTGQSFVLNNTGGFVTFYSSAAPNGTPIPWLLANNLLAPSLVNDLAAVTLAETTDTDGDGVPNWMEFQAATNPNDRTSFFAITALNIDPIFNVTQVSFSTVTNRVYRVDATSTLTNWTTLIDNVSGIGGTNNGVMNFTDPRPNSTLPNQFYRVLAH